MSRPPALFPLFADMTGLPGIGPKTARTLASAGIEAPRDLIYTLPHDGISRRSVASVLEAGPGDVVTVEVTVGRHLAARRKGAPHRVEVTDARTAFQVVYFHGRPEWIAGELPTGARRVISGKLELFDGLFQMPHPDHVLVPASAGDIAAYEPVYSRPGGIAQKTMQRAIGAALDGLPDLPEWIDPAQVRHAGWPDWGTALRRAHSPETDADIAREAPARSRLAYDEFLAHQITLALVRRDLRRAKGVPSLGDGRLSARVLAALPYAPTGAQRRATAEIAADMASDRRMVRLLQGDVGAGKTLVAFLALLVAVEAGGQGAMMAPTEILARQHLEALAPLAEAAGVRLDILTGRDKGPERVEKLAALASGRTQILVGTHALFQADVTFQDLRLAIVDEQHRFGVSERMQFGAKGRAADMLVMTATPIPRSLSLARYGHMDVSILDEKPPGRKPIATALVSAGRLDEVLSHLGRAISEGRQAYWVCPLVEESEAVDLTAAEERFRHLRAVLGDGVVGLVHGQLPPAEKDAAMARFVSGKTKVLVATTVIEVGVNVPDATIMVIERAENFGLAQLHQLRGRVGRGELASTCLLIYKPPLGASARRRLETLRGTEDGFAIAEADLEMRGEGDPIGMAQAGFPRFRVADAERQAGLMQTAQTDARALVDADPELRSSRGEAARILLWLMRQDRAIRLISSG